MSWLIRLLKQTCTYWEPGVPDASGNYIYTAPVSIACHWEDKQEEYIASDGAKKISQSIVTVGQDLQTGGYLFLGISAATSPGEVEGAHLIQAFAKVPGVSAKEFERTAWL